MRIAFFSDLHFEFGTTKEQPSGDILVLAGDFTTKANELHIDWLNRLDFKDVLYVLGNHEFYHGDIDWIYEETKKKIAPHVHMLQNDSIVVQGQRFIGATLWTDYDNKNALTMLDANRYMNDHRVIRHDWLAKEFKAEDALKRHEESVEYLRNNMTPGDVVVTHHGPSKRSVHPIYKNDNLNGAYVTDLEWLMEEKKPKLWFHGHVHSCFDYVVHDTRVLTNPRGYEGYERVPGFNWHKSVVI